MKHFTKFYYFTSLLICFLFSGQYSYADGSKDLYGSGSGGRAKLRSSTVTAASYPFANLNTHYVYAVAGETITLASSVMGTGSSRIKLTKPNGTMTSYSSGGLIANRNQEVAGPRLPNVVGGNYYTPITYTVQPGETGIFSVDFVPPAGETANSQDGREGSGVSFTANWAAQGASDIMISAWDVSIYNSGNAFIPGRVYATVLNLDINPSFSAANTYYGKMYVLTKDGYTYKVDNNGNNGISFEFFVNSNGFVNGAGEPIYKSLNTTTGISSQIKDPRTADNTTSVTHKMFYTLPANDLPASASGAVAGGTGTTWLKNPRLVPEVSDLKLFGVEGTEGQVSHKGGNIKFSANLSGRYIIEISAVAPANFPTRTITGFASVGPNSVNWDGKDGLGNPLPSGNSPAKLTIRLQGAEVHFPYFDMEINPNGIKLELLNAGLNAVESDIVYWNDTDITLTSGVNNPPSNPINASQSAIPAGTSSNTNGHKWGSNSSPTSGTFGDNRSMDTWTFVLGAEETLNTVISTKIADLKVNSITPNVSTVGTNGNITYTVEVQNSDGSAAYSDVTNAPFSFNVPAGMEIVSVVYVSACGTETNGAISADKLHYNAELQLTNGCKGTYTIVTKAVGVSSGNVMVEATIMRPNDVNDPDATNPDPNVLPTDPHLECKNGTATESCNNIKYNNVVTVINKITAVKSIVGNPVTVKPGDVLTYNIVLTNTDGLPKTGVTASDNVPGTLTGITAISNAGVLTGNKIDWTGLTVPANGSLTLSFSATVVANVPVGTTSIKNVASIIDPIDPTVPVTPEVEKPIEGKITAVKTIVGNPATVKSGDVLTYNIVLTNSFGTAKTGVTASDNVPNTLTGITAISNGGTLTGNKIDWTGLTVPANGSLTLSFNATVVANFPAGTTSIKNVASIIDPIDPTVPVTPEVEKPTEGKITAIKTIVGNPATVKPGDVLTYNIVLTNSFGTAKTGVAASDVLPATLTGATGISHGGTLTGQTINWTGLTVPANGTLTLSFSTTAVNPLAAGTTSIKNTASIVDPIDPTVPVTPEVEKPTEGKITAVKTIVGNPATVKPGDVLTYNIVLTNSFGTAKTGITASDVLPATLTSATGISHGGTLTGQTINWTGLTVPANGSLTLSFNATVVTNLPAGTTSIKNTASIVDPIDPTVPVTPEVEKPTEGKITAVKTIVGNPATVKPGDVLTYNIVLTNSFGTAKTGLTASDNVPNTLTGITAISNGGTLTGNKIDWTGLTVPANGSLTLSFNATVVANLPAGTSSIKNTASIVDPIDPAVPVTPEVEKPTEGKITAVKTIVGNPATVKPGDVLTYNIVLTNSFGTAKTGVTASDNVPSTLTGITAISNAGALTGNKIDWTGLTVPANGSLTLSFNATVVANLPAGTTSIKNVASIIDPIDPTVPVAPEVEKPTEGKITAVKTIVGNPATVKPGDVLTYNIVLTNSFGTAKTGVTASDNVPSTLTGITAISNAGALTGNKIDWTGLTVPANGSLTLSFKAIVSGNLPVGTTSIKNVASIIDPIDPTVPVVPEIELPVNESPAINLVKTVTNTGTGVGGAFNVGDKIEYTFTIKNTGDVTLYNINITDPLISNSAINIPGSILPNNEVKQVVNYTVTQADADAGNVTNSALAKASSPAGNIIEDKSGTTTAGDDPTITTITQNPSLSLSKTAVVGVHNKIGDVISYNLVVKNTGNVTLTAIAITDANADAGSISPALIAGLAPNATANITAKHTVTQADLDRGYVANIAKADGKDPKGGNVHAESTDPTPIPGTPVDPTCTTCTITPIQQTPAIKLTKTAVAGPYNKVGDIINYNLVLENTGNVTVTKITISDANADAGSITPATIATLAPNATIGIKAKHTVTQSDLDKGYVSNLAKADAEGPNGGNVHAESTDPAPTPGAPVDPTCPTCTITPVEQKAAVALVKTITNAGTGENGAFVLGNQIEYTFTVSNTGNVSLKDLVLSDPLLNKLNITIPGVILPGKSVSHIEKYTITAADVIAGKVTNQAVIKATDPKGGNVTDQSGTATNNDNPTVITIAKPPVVKDDIKETQQNKLVIIDVQKNDEPGSSAIVPGSTTIITQPKNGTVKVNTDGTVTYTPNQGYTGTDEFTYTVTDKNGQISNPAKVTLTVVPTKPVAMDDIAETQWNTEVKIPLLGNDKTDGAPFDKGTVEITAQPKHGTISVNPDGTVTYLPNSGYTGTDTFKYRVKDEYGNWTDIATVTLNVKGFFIPNVITPNGDGKNDTFLIVGLENFGNADVTIFNRWGNEVYRNNNYKNTWTGEGLNEGTYYYLIRLNNNGKQEVYKGWVLIKR